MKYKIRFSLFFTAMILFNLAANFAHPVTPTIIQDLQLPDYMFGLMLACMQFSNFLFSPFWGKLNGAISSRQTLMICCVGYGVAQLGFACAPTQGMILLVRVLAGVFVGGIFVSFLTYVINTAKPEDQAKYLTYSATIQAVFGAFGYLVGGILGEFSIRGTFFLQAFCLGLAGVMFRLVCLPDGQQETTASGAAFLNGIALLPLFRGTGYDKNQRTLTDFGSEVFIIDVDNHESLKEFISDVCDVFGWDVNDLMTFESTTQNGEISGWDIEYKADSLLIWSREDNSIPWAIMAIIEELPWTHAPAMSHINVKSVDRHHLG